MQALINNNKLCFYLNRLNSPTPITADVVLTNNCNLNCNYCRYEKGNDHMPVSDFIRLAARLQELGVEGLILTGGGEPMLHKDFSEIISFLNSSGIKYGINTNLPAIPVTKAKWIKVSIHNKANESKVKQLRLNNPLCEIGVQGIVAEDDDIRKIYGEAKGLDVDYIVFRPIESDRPVYTKKQVALILKELELLQVTDSRVVINYKWHLVFNTFKKCSANWTNLFINYNCDVWYCCHKQEVIGSIFDKDILEKKARHITDMATCEKPCRLSGSNIYLDTLPQRHLEFL